VKVPKSSLQESRTPIIFKVVNAEDPTDIVTYESAFFGPNR
jgi:hypothetical protein